MIHSLCLLACYSFHKEKNKVLQKRVSEHSNRQTEAEKKAAEEEVGRGRGRG